MRLLMSLLFIVVLFGCSNTNALDDYIEKNRTYAENPATDYEEYIDFLQEYNNYLKGIKDVNLKQYVELQIEANNMRIEGLEKENYNLVSDSAWKDAEARSILENINNAK